MSLSRSSGVLLHLTSLPGGEGIGDLGAGARRWLEWLDRSGCGLWQFLPLGPVGGGWSPYQSPSTFAGNPLLISLQDLVARGWLTADEVDEPPTNGSRVDFEAVQQFKVGRMRSAAERWRRRGRPERDAFEGWRTSQAPWLDDFTLFTALKESFGGAAWTEWPPDLARRRPEAMARAGRELETAVEDAALQQYWFALQWESLREEARRLGIRLVGDLPIYTAFDSADVWARSELFQLDEAGRPTVIAGVPPDYFSETGQLWSNPIYNWGRHAQDGYSWWIERLRHSTRQVDIVRIDHFRGLEAYWEVPAGSETAASGRWVPGPGADLLEAVRTALGGLPFIAEDLGVVTPGVLELLDRFDLPGMKVLQFGLEGGEKEGELPSAYPVRSVAYTGTHDNDTSRGWYESVGETTQEWARRALHASEDEIPWRMIESLWASPAGWTLAPLQDVLDLGGSARMNYPGRALGNWMWRAEAGNLRQGVAESLRTLNETHGRLRAA